MLNVLVNGLSAKAGGGKEILENFLSEATSQIENRKIRYFVLTPSFKTYKDHQRGIVTIVRLPYWIESVAGLGVFYVSYVRALVQELRIDVVWNFGDIVLTVGYTPQIYFFDWSYAVYPESRVWEKMGWRDYLRRKVKCVLISLSISNVAVAIAQTEVIARRLRLVFGRVNVITIPTPIGAAFVPGTEKERVVSRTRILACVSSYAPHKNIEIFLPLVRLFKRDSLDYQIITTIDDSQSEAARRLLEIVTQEGLSSHWRNVGKLAPTDVAKLYLNCDGLILPTILESYGLPFIEAMAAERTVLASDMDFAKVVCGGAGYYFDPFCVENVKDTIVLAFADEKLRKEKIAVGKSRVDAIPKWNTVFQMYEKLIVSVALENNIPKQNLTI